MNSKKLFLSLMAILAFAGLSAQQKKDNKPRVEGSGNTVTKDFNVQSFDQLDVKGVFSLQLSQGNKEEVRIEADDNLQQYFQVKNNGSTLVIDMDDEVNINSKGKMKVYVTFKKLKSMDLKTVGDISSANNLSFDQVSIESKTVGNMNLKLTAQTLNLDNHSVGEMKLSGKADNVVIKNKSVGSLEAGDLLVQTMDIDNKGVGSVQVNASKELKVKESFMGKVINKGSAPVKKSGKTEI